MQILKSAVAGTLESSDAMVTVEPAEMTPGPLGLNCATFAGMQAAGVPGAIAANLGVMTPAYTLTAVAAMFFAKFQDAPLMKKILLGVRPACLGMIIGLLLSMSIGNYFPGGAVKLPALVIGAVDLVLLMKYKLSVPRTIILSAVMGLVMYGFLGLPV